MVDGKIDGIDGLDRGQKGVEIFKERSAGINDEDLNELIEQLILDQIQQSERRVEEGEVLEGYGYRKPTNEAFFVNPVTSGDEEMVRFVANEAMMHKWKELSTTTEITLETLLGAVDGDKHESFFQTIFQFFRTEFGVSYP